MGACYARRMSATDRPKSDATPPVSVDARGTWCPVPIVRIAEALDKVEEGAIVELASTDPGVRVDLPEFCTSNGHEHLGDSRDGSVIRSRVRKGVATRSAPAKARALGLVSGGLDSTLAVELLRDQGVDVRAVHFSTGFCMVDHRRALGRASDLEDPDRVHNPAVRAGAAARVPLEVVDVAEEYLREVVLEPKYGYGAAMNPCIDCRIFMLKKAAAMADAEGREVVFTGEVVGQRPMSQRRATLDLVERESGTAGRLLRPLSARHLPPTDAEREGRVDRDRLGAMHGRGREGQFDLAGRFGVEGYPQPGGGCCYLADHAFGRRLRDLLSHRERGAIERDDILRLKVGRHLRVRHDVKVVVGRDEPESTFLRRNHAGAWTAWVADRRGAFCVVDGELDDDAIRDRVAGIAARYSRHREAAEVEVELRRGDDAEIRPVAPAPETKLAAWRV